MAGWDIQELVSEALKAVLSDVASDLITSGMGYLTDYIVAPINLQEIPHFNDFLMGAKAIGASLVILFLYLAILSAMRDMATGEDDPNWAGIIGSAAISMGFVFSFDFILFNYMIPIINEVVTWISGFEININVGGKILEGMSPQAGLSTASLHILFMGVIFGVGAFVLVIASFINTAHLVIAVLAGPLIMASYTNRSGVFKSYLTELGAVLFTPIIHVLTFMLVLSTASKGTFPMLLLSFAFMIIGATGPHILRMFLLNTGTASGATGTAKFAAYKVMLGGLKK